jgi:hypothetical protein
MKINSLRNGEIIRFQFKPKGNPYVGQDQIELINLLSIK